MNGLSSDVSYRPRVAVAAANPSASGNQDGNAGESKKGKKEGKGNGSGGGMPSRKSHGYLTQNVYS